MQLKHSSNVYGHMVLVPYLIVAKTVIQPNTYHLRNRMQVFERRHN